VAYYVEAKKKYIRCEVTDIQQQYKMNPSYNIFALDYGIPLVLKNRKDLIKIPSRFKHLPSPIIRCGLDVLPAATTFCFNKLKEVSKGNHEWTLEGLEHFWKMMNRPILEFEHTYKDIKYKDTKFGILKVLFKTGEIVDINQRLVNSEVAWQPKSIEEFFKNFMQTSTPSIEIWNDNFRSGGVLKEGEIRPGILPNFNRLFHDLDKPKMNIHSSLSVYEKVNEWRQRNEGVEHEIPSDHAGFDEEVDSEILFELNDFNHEDNKDDDHVNMSGSDDLTHAEVRRQLEKLAAMEAESNKFKLRNKTNKMQFFPGGYQIQLVVQPNYTDNFDEEQMIPTTSSKALLKVQSDNDEKW
jgi:hypothetical protein